MSSLIVTLGVSFIQAGDARAQLPGEEHVILVIDRSGSMMAGHAASGTTRWDVAMDRARSFVTVKSATPFVVEFAVWTFEGTTYIEEQGFSDAATTLSTIDALAVGYGTTPLAMTVCDAVDELLDYKDTVAAFKILKLISDGEENSTPSTDQCGGPSSATDFPNLTPNSWQWKVRNKLRTGDANDDSVGVYPVVLDVDVLYNHITNLMGESATVSELGAGNTQVTTTASLTASFFAFLQGVSVDSGGTFTAISSADPVPVTGDVNQDYCVDYADYTIVMANYGQMVPPANADADLNQDGLVDYYDYQIVSNNWGAGCGTLASSQSAPSPMPGPMSGSGSGPIFSP